MKRPDWLTKGELCVSCGVCCLDISTAPITVKDMERMMSGLGVTLEEIRKGFVWGNPYPANELLIDAESGCCPAFKASQGKFTCQIYEQRPDICRNYACVVLKHAEDWFDQNGQVASSNFFYGCRAPADVKRLAFASGRQFMRATFAWGMNNYVSRPSRITKRSLRFLSTPEKLVQIENTFPPSRIYDVAALESGS